MKEKPPNKNESDRKKSLKSYGVKSCVKNAKENKLSARRKASENTRNKTTSRLTIQ
jgi:hypothetical protein